MRRDEIHQLLDEIDAKGCSIDEAVEREASSRATRRTTCARSNASGRGVGREVRSEVSNPNPSPETL